MTTPGWNISSWVARTRASRIGRAQRQAGGASALLKVSTADAGIFRDEYALLRSLDVPGIVRPLELTVHGTNPAMVLDARDVVGLKNALAGAPFDLGVALRAGCALARSLAGLHATGLLHGDLRPDNVLLERATGATWIADLSALAERRRAPADAQPVIEDWAWVAPEQTGRMNRPVDERADFYVLGLLLYHMLTGRAPFEAADALEWAHCHTARTPVPPATAAPQVPPGVSALVMKLLAKTAEERYRHAEGLLADLQRCSTQWEQTGSVGLFALGADDAADSIEPPRRLYGREHELAALRDSYARTAATAQPELVLVTGAPGTGKTSLVQALREPAVAAHGHFVAAKFDSEQRNVPYATLVRALHDLVRQVLAEPDTRVTAWSQLIAEALGGNGRLMVDVVPSLASIIGPQPSVPELAPAEAQNRMRWVLGRFVGVFARAEHPLVLFLDDLQWADVASLSLLRELLARGPGEALLVVGAYRDQEVDAAHPLAAMLELAQADGARIRRIELGPLGPAHVTALVADSLRAAVAEAEPLAALVLERTGGNPFFVLQVLAELRTEGLLRFDAARNGWRWDLQQVRARNLADNVVHLVARRLRRLPRPVLDLLRRAACLGTSGNVALLATALGRTQEDVEAALVEAARAGFVTHDDGDYRFPHDRVREAAYALIPRARRAEMHLRIGRHMLAALAPSALDERVFDVVSQLNRGAALVTEPADVLQLARLNAFAGRKAKAALAFAAAREHLARAAAAWPADGWESLYEETFALQFDLAESEFLVASFQDADVRLEALLGRARSRSERARIYGLRIRLRLVPGQFGAAADAALDALRLFGITFPDGDATEQVLQMRREIDRELGGRGVDALLDAPPLEDAEARTVLALMVDSFTGIYIARPAVFPLLVLRATLLVLRHGNCEESAVVYTYYARVLLATFGEIAAAYEYSLLAVRLNEKLGDRKRRGMLLFSHAGFIHFWRRPFAGGRPILDLGFAACLEVGNFVHAALIAVNSCLYMVEGGERLDELVAQAERATEFLRATHSGGTLEVVQVFTQFARCLQGRTRGPASFDDETYDHAAAVQRLVAQNNVAGLAIVHMLEQVAAGVAGDSRAALESAQRTQGVLRAVFAMAVRPTFVFYRALALAATHGNLPAPEQAENLRALSRHEADLATWAAQCPQNYETRHALVAAERARLEGQELQAERLYEQAIGAARASGLPHQEALACERAADFHRARGLVRIADGCLADAHAAYTRWGAVGAARRLEALHPALRAAAAAAVPIDTLAVVKATQAVSGEIDLDALLDTLMRIALEQAGAQSGRLYVTAGERLELAASADVCGERLAVTVHPPGTVVGDDDAAHPGPILNYVRRSREQVLLGDATQPHPYADDAYLRHRQPRSVLCVPLVRQARTIGVLYLEHLLVTHAFTPSHAAVLGMLAGQAAISLETARLYAALKEEYAQRQRAEAATLEWQARIGRLVESNIIAVRIADLDGRIVDANDAYLRIVGYTREDMAAGRLTREIVTAPEYQAADRHALAELMRDGRYAPYEKEYVRKDGTRVPVLAGGILFQGERPQTVGFVLDLTERRRAEAEHRARLAAEEANQAKSAFLANMSHELRTPMNAIIGMSELALRTDLDARQADYISKVNGAARSLLVLINDILDLSKIEAGQFTIENIPFELGAVMDNLADMVRLTADEKGLELVLAPAAGVPTHLIGDPQRLGQVLLNLCNNALKFTERGEVVLSVRELARDAETVTLRFEVRDTGIGIDAATQRRLFEPFTQADSSTSRRFGGTGLGLAISRHLVGLMGGEIGLDSAPGRGSTFFFQLRVGLGAEQLRISLDALRGTRVLVVDDNESARAALAEMARSFGLRPDCVAGGAAGIEAIVAADDADQPYGLLLLDYAMPGMDGVACAHRLHQASLRHDAPIIMLVTAFDRDLLLKRVADEHVAVAATLSKPVTPSALLDACVAALAGRAPRQTRAERRDLARRTDAGRLAGARVLVVEDNPINQEVAQGLLEPAGVALRVANNGREALDILATERFDAVLMDCQMPVMDGYETARAIRADPRLKDLPLIAMTAAAMVSDREEALAAGMNDHLTKPINVGDLYATLARWIGAWSGADAAPRSPAQDRADAIERLGGNEALYERMRTMFGVYRATFCDRFRQARASGDVAAQLRLAHDLKGVTAVVGEAALSQAAEALELACRGDAGQVDDSFEALQRLLSPRREDTSA